MIIQIFLFLLIGLFIGYLAYFLFNPQTRVFDPWGVIILGVVGSLVGGLLTPWLGIFALPFVLLGSIIMATVFATFFVWVSAIVVMIISARPADRNTISAEEATSDETLDRDEMIDELIPSSESSDGDDDK